MQVSSVTDHVGSQETGAKSADFDDDDGGGLVSFNLFIMLMNVSTFTYILSTNIDVSGITEG